VHIAGEDLTVGEPRRQDLLQLDMAKPAAVTSGRDLFEIGRSLLVGRGLPGDLDLCQYAIVADEPQAVFTRMHL
jgi:hypothetical protein